MGQFGDWVKKNSKYLNVGYGESINVIWNGKADRVKDPKFGEGWEFEFETSDGVKLYTIRTTSLVSKFDDYNAGDKLIIWRNHKGIRPSLGITKDGEPCPFSS